MAQPVVRVLRHRLAPLFVALPLLHVIAKLLLPVGDGLVLASNLLQCLTAVAAAATAVWAGRTLRRDGLPQWRAWAVIGVAQCIFAAGAVGFAVVEIVQDLPPYPGWPDIFYYAFYPLMIAGLLAYPRSEVDRRYRLDQWLDLAALSLVAGTAIWHTVARPLLLSLMVSPSPGVVASTVYVVLDTILLVVLLDRLVGNLGGARQFTPLLLLVLGGFSLVAADLLEGIASITADFASGSWIDLGWVVFCSAVGLAALDDLRSPHEEERSDLAFDELTATLWSTAVTYAWLAVALAVLVASFAGLGQSDFGVLGVAAIAATVLVIARQSRSLGTVRTLLAQLQEARHGLEAAVQERTRELRDSELRFRAIFDSAHQYMGLIAPDGTLLEANDTALRLVAAKREEVIGRKLWDTPWWSHSAPLQQQLRDAVSRAAEGETVTFEAQHALADGTTNDVAFSLKPLRDESGAVVLLLPEGLDITERKQAEALRLAEIVGQKERQQALLDLATHDLVIDGQERKFAGVLAQQTARLLDVDQAGFWRFDFRGRVLRCVRQWDAVREAFTEPGDLDTTTFPAYAEALRSGGLIDASDAVTDQRTAELAESYLLPLGIRSLLDAPVRLHGQVVGVLCVEHVREPRVWQPAALAFVTTAAEAMAQCLLEAERREREKALRASEERFRRIVSGMPDGVLIATTTGRFLEVSDSACGQLGYTRDELLALTVADIVPESERAAATERLNTRAPGRQLVERYHRRKDGTVLPVELAAIPLEFAGQSCLLGVARDISERKAVEAAKHESDEALRRAFAQIPLVLFVQDEQGTYLDANSRFEEALGWRRDQVLGATSTTIGTEADPERAAELRRQLLREGRLEEVTLTLVARDGTAEPGLVWASRLHMQGQPRLLFAWQGIGERLRTEAEREALITRLEVTNAELERFTYTVSHDLKSPLVTIRSYVDLALEDLRDGATGSAEECLERVNTAASRMMQLLGDLLELSRIGRLKNEEELIDLRELTGQAVELNQGRLSEKRVRVMVDPDLPLVFGDRARLLEVFQNLIDNGAKFAPPDGRGEIAVRHLGVDPQTGWPTVEVADNGQGFDPSQAERIFGLFEQLDPSAGGTGIGLALARRIVEIHGGQIRAESRGSGTGASFRLTLPPPPSG